MRALLRGGEVVELTDLLAALVDEPESRASEILAGFGLVPERVWELLGSSSLSGNPSFEAAETADLIPVSAALRIVLGDAAVQARASGTGRLVSTEHLLAALVAVPGSVADVLIAAGIELPALATRMNEQVEHWTAPIPMLGDIPRLELGEPGQDADLGRILDASANRAREGLRVVEDYVRFALDDPGLTRRLKEVRHRLAAALRGLDPGLLLTSRDTPGDVGTHIMTPSERTRENPRAVLAANFKRTTEALRSLEEYTKLVDNWLAGRFEVLRYDVYTLEKLTLTAAAAAKVLGDARLMVLVGGLATLGDLTWVVGEALAGGADVIQLREKNRSDREWLTHAREVRILTAKAGARLIVNDRPDLARLACADGVHLGQDDMNVRDARRMVGPSMMIGVSTHTRDQLDRGVLDGAGYLGVGPVFASQTKDFQEYVGLTFVREAAEVTALPWFAIGGIDEDNIEEVIEAGARRVAVSSAVVHADRPRRAAAELRARLDASWA
jgi:thiamine-phosphate pyrophosphorylase